MVNLTVVSGPVTLFREDYNPVSDWNGRHGRNDSMNMDGGDTGDTTSSMLSVDGYNMQNYWATYGENGVYYSQSHALARINDSTVLAIATVNTQSDIEGLYHKTTMDVSDGILTIATYTPNGDPIAARDSEVIIWGPHEYDLTDPPPSISVDRTYAEGEVDSENDGMILCFAGGLLTSQYTNDSGLGYAVGVLEETVGTDTAVYYMAFHSEEAYEWKYVKVAWSVSGTTLTQSSSLPQETIAAALAATADAHTAIVTITDPPL